MNRQVRRVGLVLTLMFLALFAMASSIQVLRTEALYEDPRNVRASLETYKTQRGSILVGGEEIVSSTPVNDAYRFLREYDSQIYSAVTGYFSIFTGNTGIEREMNTYLSGQSSAQFFEQINALLDGTPVTGAAVELTLDPEIQRAAWDALGNRKGAVVAIEPSTGRILAMVSKPTFDANLLAGLSFGPVSDSYRTYAESPDAPLINRAIGGDLYHPGSVFKLVVAAAALESGEFTATSELPNPESYQLPGSLTEIQNATGSSCGAGETVTLERALIRSCNIPFAWLAQDLGQDKIRAQAELMGFGDLVEIPLTVTASIYPEDMDLAQTALTGFGQFDVRTSPMQMAMVTAGIANQGVIMTPQLIELVVASNLNILEQRQPTVYSSPISRETAGLLTRMMVDSVEVGVASRAGISQVAVAGKTGTAENGPDDPYTLWFTGFAPAEAPEIVVTVVVEDGGGVGQNGTGNQIAAPIARAVMEAALRR
ncbi:MAG: penicillin-binding transpeptidase domain-containing protein [Aquiluna sp.]|jgi:penicillin-binding protein A|nr:penicillin-binding transpeptidase domain-containing protein [Aquiluna sp.]MDP5025435.1 penicillin-binding transpeptidase domain-containing protein [Aquiluna sp.]